MQTTAVLRVPLHLGDECTPGVAQAVRNAAQSGSLRDLPGGIWSLASHTARYPTTPDVTPLLESCMPDVGESAIGIGCCDDA
jgi:hypothetical protein